MMRTRRRTKVPSAPQDTEIDGHGDFSLEIPADIDLDTLAEILPNTNFVSPSHENIITVYRLLLAQGLEGRSISQELDEAKAELDKKEVELDQALQEQETASREYEAQLGALNKEFAGLKQERDQLFDSQSALKTQISELSTSQSSSTTEVDTLKRRLGEIEQEKRELVGVISRSEQESAHQEEEVQALRANLKEARQEHQALEAQVRELRSTGTSTKFTIDSLEQQLKLAQAEVERTNAELSSKTEEFSKYRRTKHAETTTLQASFDSLTETNRTLSTSLKSLQSNYNTQHRQLTEALTKVQDLTGQLAEQEATFASEANGLRRLVTMMEEREKQAKEIVDGIEKEWAEVGEKSERRESALRAEAERERKGRDVAEKKVEQLEIVLDRMSRGELPIPVPGTPGTPLRRPGSADSMTDAMMGLSPTVAMASRVQKAGKTFTEVYADYVRLQDEFAKKCAEYDHMDRTLASVLGQIEERAPILSQQRAEYERLQAEASQLASQLAQALLERDQRANLASENSQKLIKSAKENELLQKQLEDLGRQVQGLLREISRRDDPTIPSDEDLDEMNVVPAEDTEAVITNNLVLFRSVGGLQEQNRKLLKIVREMGKKMESEEREYKDAMEREQIEAIKEAHEALEDMAAQMERQKKNNETIIQAYVKERDTLRAMLARAENTGAFANTDVAPDQTKITSEASKELAEVQNQFEAYRKEMGIDASKLRDDLGNTQREIGKLTTLVAKANANVDFLSERHRMDQEQLALRGRELDDLSKRNQQLQDQYTRLDIECGRVTEELQVAGAKVERLRNECANLRAEKQIWESVQARLINDNKNLEMQRSHFSDLMSNVQKMHHDLERSGENDRRRLESQLKMLEDQTHDLRTQLSQERDNIRHLNLQKDLEAKEFHNRFEKMTQEFSKTRESLVEAQTSKKHLEERVEGLAKQLKADEEKLAVYERRPTADGTVVAVTNPDLSREEQLEAEVAELRSTLKVAELDLATARRHVQQFQEISQANEQALANLNAVYDEYRASTEAQIARHESEHQALQQKFQAAQDELNALTAKFNELQKTLEAERVAWTMDKKVLEDTIVDLSTSEKHSESDRAAREQEVRQQEERTKAAEERYAKEVVSHAESIKTIEILKRDLTNAQASVRDNLTAAETAKSNLMASEASWNQQKDALDKEVADLNTRCKDLTSQNSILHQHLESVSSQASRIKAAASSSSAIPDIESAGDAETQLSELRSLVALLRKEKEIVDLQLDVNKQSISRQKADMERLTKELDKVRQALSEEREKAVENATTASQHAELLERINQLNILRESNATLRADCQNYAKKSRELDAKLKQLSGELDPAKEQARMAQAELEACKAQLARVEEEGRKWQERNAQLLSKYDRIDPAEVQALRDEIEQLKLQKAELEKQKTDVEHISIERQTAIEGHSNRMASLEKNLQNLKEHSRKNLSIFKDKIATANNDVKTLTDQKIELETKIAELEKVVAAAQTTEERPTGASDEQQKATIALLENERDKLLAEKATWSLTPSTANELTNEKPKDWETEKAALEMARDEALAKLKAAAEEAQRAVEESKNMKLQSEKFQAKITSMMKAKAAEDEKHAAAEKAGQDINVEKLHKQHQEELQALETKLTAQHQEELKAATEAVRKETVAPSTSSDEEIKVRVTAALAEHDKAMEAKRAAEIDAAIERGRIEQQAKAKLKDAQLVRAQKKVKDLETQILEWRNAGILPDAPASTPTLPAASSTILTVPPVASSATSTVPLATITSTPAPSAAAASSSVPAGQASKPGQPGASSTLPNVPRKSAVLPTGPGSASGVGRGSIALRARGAQRIPARSAPHSQPSQAGVAGPSGGMSIMGAAAKRARESETAESDSLTKRLKPAEPTPKPPVSIRRPPGGPTPS